MQINARRRLENVTDQMDYDPTGGYCYDNRYLKERSEKRSPSLVTRNALWCPDRPDRGKLIAFLGIPWIVMDVQTCHNSLLGDIRSPDQSPMELDQTATSSIWNNYSGTLPIDGTAQPYHKELDLPCPNVVGRDRMDSIDFLFPIYLPSSCGFMGIHL